MADAVAAGAAAEIDELLPFATSAVREAANGPEVLALVESTTGVRLQVLTGDDEARLTFLAVRRWFGWSAGEILLVDIGGGSLELAAGGSEFPDVAVSLPLGRRAVDGELPARRPAHRRPGRRAPAARARAAAGGPVRGSPTAPTPRTWSGRPRRSARSPAWRGPARTASARRTAGCCGAPSWRTGCRGSRGIPADARPALPGITADRTFQIVAGGIVLAETMRAFGLAELEVSPWALREGLILRYLDA